MNMVVSQTTEEPHRNCRTNGSRRWLLGPTRQPPKPSQIRKALQESVYTLCPEGDTPDSNRIYDAISALLHCSP